MKKTITRTVYSELEQKFLVRAGGDDVLNVQFTIQHDRPNTNSRVAICILASGRSRVAVDATVIIEKSAPNSNAWLEIRVITRESATVIAAPNLKIRNNAVKAGHTLATKYISDEEMFYLMSRGLSRAEAEKLVVDAFKQSFLDGDIIEL